MNKVEIVLFVDPFAAAVIYFETTVVGLRSWLDRREVCFYHFCIWESDSNVSGKKSAVEQLSPASIRTLPICQYQYLETYQRRQ